MQQVAIFDATLRDGEQTPGFSMNVKDKLLLARQLERLNVDVINRATWLASRGGAAVRRGAAVRGERLGVAADRQRAP